MRPREACSLSFSQPRLRRASCECSLPCKFVDCQRHGNVACAGSCERPEGGAAAAPVSSSSAAMRRNHQRASGRFLRITPLRALGVLSLKDRFSCLCVIGYPHLIYRYLLRISDLTVSRIFLKKSPVNKLCFVNRSFWPSILGGGTEVSQALACETPVNNTSYNHGRAVSGSGL